MKKLLVLLCLGLLGCATASNLNNVSLGMSKSDVVKALGSPSSVSAKDNVEYLQYSSYKPFTSPSEWHSNYFVRLVNGKVESYGKVGDFDSTKNPTGDINLTVKSDNK